MPAKLKGSKKCSRCGARGYVTDWRPERGLDHRLRQFKCGCCSTEFITLVHNPEFRKLYDQEEGSLPP